MALISRSAARGALQAGANSLLTAYTTLAAALAKSPLASRITVDGTTVEYAEAMERLWQLQTEIARASGIRPLVKGADLRVGTL